MIVIILVKFIIDLSFFLFDNKKVKIYDICLKIIYMIYVYFIIIVLFVFIFLNFKKVIFFVRGLELLVYY